MWANEAVAILLGIAVGLAVGARDADNDVPQWLSMLRAALAGVAAGALVLLIQGAI